MDTNQTVAAHLRSVFGPPSRSAAFSWERQDVAVYKWDATRTGEGVDLYVTDSGAPLAPTTHVAEFFTGLTPGRDDIAGSLASLHRYQHVHGVWLGHGHTVPSDEPLWPDTALDSMLVLRQAATIIPAVPYLVPRALHRDALRSVRYPVHGRLPMCSAVPIPAGALIGLF